MSAEQYFHLCRKNIGAPAEIRCHDGKVYRGIIDRVDQKRVYIRPLESSHHGQGPGMHLWGWGYGAGLAIGIALGSIATIAFFPFFWW